MHSADPPDRIDDAALAMAKNGVCDLTGRFQKSRGTSIVTTADALGILATSGRTAIRSIHTYEGRVGENPDQRLLVIAGAGLCRSKANDLRSRYDDITFPSDIDTPALDRPAAGAFRNEYFYHQNGLDFPFRIKCEEDDPTATLTLQAEVLGLKPPARCMWQNGSTAGNARRFAANAAVSYCITFVYGTRGESGPGPVMTYFITAGATVDELNYEKIPLGGTGVTARRIYRSKIGLGKNPVGGTLANGLGKLVVDWIEKGPVIEMFLVAELPDNTTTTWVDEFDNNSLDINQRVPRPRPFPPISQYQIMHLDRLFWGKLKEHPWTLGVLYDNVRTDIAPTDYRVTISNTGAGTITFEKNVAGWTTDFTIASYKTLTLRSLMLAMLFGGVAGAGVTATDITSKLTTAGVCPIPQGLIDLDRTYAFKEVSQQSIFTTAYWFTAIDDDNVQGPRWHPNRVQWSDIVHPEQVSFRNSIDLTRFGSKRITGLILMDNTPVVTTDTDSWLLPGSFIPDNDGVPAMEVHRSQASHGSICTRPDAMTTVPGVGTAMVAHDSLRAFRGEGSLLWAPEIRDWFRRIHREPVTRDFLTATYFKGEVFIALATDETGGGDA